MYKCIVTGKVPGNTRYHKTFLVNKEDIQEALVYWWSRFWDKEYNIYSADKLSVSRFNIIATNKRGLHNFEVVISIGKVWGTIS